MKVIEVVVSARGETTVTTKGFSGAECQQASKWIEGALGATISEQKTAEFYAPSTSQQSEVKA
jgi:Protein of unknown function (DUF2997)